MANPQREHGHVRIANELFDALIRTRIPGEAMQVMSVIIRQTYGWSRKSAYITIAEFSAATNIKKPHVCRAIDKLLQMNLITRTGADEWGVQKDYDTWAPLPKKVILPKKVTLPKKVIFITQKGNDALPKKATPTISKDIIKDINTADIASLQATAQETAGHGNTQEQPQKPATGQRRARKQPVIDARAGAILDHLNKTAGTRYQPNETNLGFISARLQEPGITPQICEAVIDIKVADWKANTEMRQYLRPETLFNKTKFASYSGIAIAKLQEAKPDRGAPDPLYIKRLQELDAEPTPEEIANSKRFLAKINRTKEQPK